MQRIVLVEYARVHFRINCTSAFHLPLGIFYTPFEMSPNYIGTALIPYYLHVHLKTSSTQQQPVKVNVMAAAGKTEVQNG